uniref:Uncharacterized protein n=1 Tax=Lotharella oceanica TaxID=641309 RepID=A0A7S2U1R1_9EUKA|mmetsp:Transcript_6305/g.12552  ORF Transcript_6305/g.12552 Transcript_6305/m.12552 type:complete len:210 (+) Transcript_6305:216-845(+)
MIRERSLSSPSAPSKTRLSAQSSRLMSSPRLSPYSAEYRKQLAEYKRSLRRRKFLRPRPPMPRVSFDEGNRIAKREEESSARYEEANQMMDGKHPSPITPNTPPVPSALVQTPGSVREETEDESEGNSSGLDTPTPSPLPGAATPDTPPPLSSGAAATTAAAASRGGGGAATAMAMEAIAEEEQELAYHGRGRPVEEEEAEQGIDRKHV